MSANDLDRQQVELWAERYERTCEILDRVAAAGLVEEALFLAHECGIAYKLKQELTHENV